LPADYEVHENEGVIVVTLTGLLPDDDALDLASRYANELERSPGLHELVDARDLQVADLSSSALREIAEVFRRPRTAPAGSRVALVASSDAAYGLARMYQALREDSSAEFRVFRDLESARSWLGLAPN